MLWRLNKIHEKVTQYTFFGTWENMPYYHLLPTTANRVLAEYEEGWKEFNLEIIHAARKVPSLIDHLQASSITSDRATRPVVHHACSKLWNPAT